MDMKPTRDLSNTLLLTHQNCSDGSGCAVIFLLAGGKKENIHYVPAGHGVKRFLKNNRNILEAADHTIIADVAPDIETADELEKLYYGDVTVIDHHKSALDIQDRGWCHISMEKCGTALLDDYLQPNVEVSAFVNCINDYDMWIKKDPMSDDLALFADFVEQERFVDKMYRRILLGYELLSTNDYATLEVLKYKQEKYINEIVSKPILRAINDVRYAYCFISNHQSPLLHKMLESHDVDVAVGIWLDKGTVSIRTTKNMDAMEIARLYNGGGHARAAGHSIDHKTLEEIIELIHP